jgi:hypothetical protein
VGVLGAHPRCLVHSVVVRCRELQGESVEALKLDLIPKVGRGSTSSFGWQGVLPGVPSWLEVGGRGGGGGGGGDGGAVWV